MIEINNYLTKLSQNLCPNQKVLQKIDNSYNYLEGKIFEHFRDRIEKVQIFGSYDRKTYLPQSVDSDSDVDVMIVFKTNEFQPNTFLKHLRELANKLYSRSEIIPDHPAITIELDHIRFELVPAYYENSIWNGPQLYIPAPRIEEIKWIKTNPAKLKENLLSKDKEENGMITPIIKLMKYANVLNGKPYQSFIFENHAIKSYYPEKEMKDYLFEFIDDMFIEDQTREQIKFIQELKLKRENILHLIDGNMPKYAIQELQEFLPLI